MSINEVIMDKILMVRKEGHMGARRVYIGMRQETPELGPMRYAHAGSARDSVTLCTSVVLMKIMPYTSVEATQ